MIKFKNGISRANETNLNQFEHKLVIISRAEPTGDDREAVWIQRSNNTFDKGVGIVNGKFINADGSLGTDTTLFYQDIYIPVKAGATYTISSENSSIYRIAEYNANKTFLKRSLNANASKSFTFTPSDNTYYIRVSCAISDLDTLQIEQGSTATPYSAHIKTRLYIRNNNDVYEPLDLTNIQ